MLKQTLGWLEQCLLAHPRTRRAVEIYRSNALCRIPGKGPAERIEERLLALLKGVGLDRVPCGPVMCPVCGDRCCLIHDVGLEPHQSFRTSRARLAGWLESMNAVVGTHKPSHPRRILLFSVMTHWVEYCVPLALALAGRDCLVDCVWLPWLCMDRDVPHDLLSQTTMSHWSVPPWVQIHPRVRLINLKHVKPAPITQEHQEIARRCSRTDTQYLTRRERLDEEKEAEVREVFSFRLGRNLDCLARLETWLSTNRYDSALTPNGTVYEFGAVYQWLRRYGLGVVTFDFGERKGLIFPSDSEPCMSLDTRPLWAADEPHVLTPERDRRVMDFLLRREMPNWQASDYIWDGQRISPRDAATLCTELKLDPGRPVVLMCTNIAWDSAVLGMGRAFPSMADWILETVGWFSRQPGCQLVVRCHPAEEVFPSNEPAHELIANHYPNLPDNIRVIPPTDRVNTYGLIRLSRFGLVFTTTVGLEMAVRGVPVVVAGRVHYAGKGFTFEPGTPAEYFSLLERLTARPEEMLPRQVELARCYADVYFFRYPRPIMWYNPGEIDKDLQLCSLEQLWRGECDPGFLETLDFFAGRSLRWAGSRKAA